MTDRTYVCCHAPSLALLLFETACSSYNQKGLLLGSVRRQVVTSTTDEKEANEEEKTAIYIEHCLPITDENVFGPYGELNAGFQQYLQQYRLKIVGWYSFRRNARQPRLTLQESLIHKYLLRALENVDMEAFTLALLSASSQETMSTHTFSQSFMRLNHRNTFENLRFKIYNLSDKVTNSSGYLQNVVFPVSQLFEYATKHPQKEESGVSWVKKTLVQINSQLESLNKQLLLSESQREQLQAEVDSLRDRLQATSDVPSCQCVAGVQREKFTSRFVRYNPDVRYGSARKENPMKVSDDEADDDLELTGEPSPEAKLRELTAQLLESDAVQSRTSSTPSNRSYLAAVQRSMKSVDSANCSSNIVDQ